MAVVLDTSFVWALKSPRDRHHAEARTWARHLFTGREGRLATNDYVYDECIALALARGRTLDDVRTMDAFFFGSDSPCSVMRVDGAAFDDARELLLAQSRPALTFTDWTTIVLARRLGARTFATFDDALQRAFERERGAA